MNFRANSLKRIVRKIVEYSQLITDDQININTKDATKVGNSSLDDDTIVNSISSKFIVIIILNFY